MKEAQCQDDEQYGLEGMEGTAFFLNLGSCPMHGALGQSGHVHGQGNLFDLQTLPVAFHPFTDYLEKL